MNNLLLTLISRLCSMFPYSRFNFESEQEWQAVSELLSSADNESYKIAQIIVKEKKIEWHLLFRLIDSMRKPHKYPKECAGKAEFNGSFLTVKAQYKKDGNLRAYKIDYKRLLYGYLCFDGSGEFEKINHILNK